MLMFQVYSSCRIRWVEIATQIAYVIISGLISNSAPSTDYKKRIYPFNPLTFNTLTDGLLLIRWDVLILGVLVPPLTAPLHQGIKFQCL